MVKKIFITYNSVTGEYYYGDKLPAKVSVTGTTIGRGIEQRETFSDQQSLIDYLRSDEGTRRLKKRAVEVYLDAPKEIVRDLEHTIVAIFEKAKVVKP